MKRGDKVIFRSNTPRILWGIDIDNSIMFWGRVKEIFY